MSSKESRKNMNLEYKGTIVPMVGKLMNQCKSIDRLFRIVSEKEVQNETQNSRKFDRMTIVVNLENGEYIRHYWG